MDLWVGKGTSSSLFQKCKSQSTNSAFNASISSAKSCVEWLFSDIVNYFKCIDFKKNLKTGLSNIEKCHIVCPVLQNVLTCLQYMAISREKRKKKEKKVTFIIVNNNNNNNNNNNG